MKVLISTGLCIVCLTLLSLQTNAQNSSVAIGDATPKSNAVLYLKSPGGNQGLIIPVVANTGSFGEAGMIVYSTSDQQVHFHNGSAWATLGGSGGGGGSYTLSILGNNFQLKDGATTVSTVPLSSAAPAANQLLMWDGARWIATTLSQDVGNANGVVTVNGIKGKAVPALPSSTQALVYNGTAWVFQPLTGGTDSQDLTLNSTTNVLSLTNDATTVDLSAYKQTLSITGNSLSISGGSPAVTLPATGVTSITAGTGLTGGVITTSGTVNVDVGTGANKIVQLDGTGRLPAVDGSQLTNLAGGGDITGVSAGTGLTGGAASGNATLNVNVGTGATQIVQLDATGRLPAVDGSQLTGLAGGGDITGVSAGTGLTGGAASGNATLNVAVGTTAGSIVQLDGTARLPAVDGSQLTNLAGDISGVVAGTGLTGGAASGSATLNVNVGTGATQIVQLDGTGRLPAVDGSQLTNLAGGGDITGVSAGTGLTGGAASGNATLNVAVGTTAGSIVQLDGTARLPAVDGSQLTNLAGDISGVVAGTGLTGGAASGSATLNVAVGTTAGSIVQLDGTGRLPAVDGSQLTNLAGGGDITGVTAGTGLTGGAASGNATLNVNVGTGATQIVQLDGTGRLPAVDGSQLTNLPGGSGTVTSVSVTTANGVSGTVATPTTTPAITLTLGAITPASVAATGTVTGSNVSGINTGDQTSITGNAGTATALQTGRTISMTGDVTYSSPAFNGTSNVTAAATVARINGNTVPANASGALTNDGTGNLTWTPSGGGGTVTTVSATLPISVATPTTTPVISISQANGTTNGYLSSTDWSTFNSKGSGTVTSVGLTMPSIFTVASSPVTAAGTIGVTYSGTALPVANGGTGRVTWDGLLVGAGATINDISNGNPNEVLTMVGTSPSWQLPAATGWGLTGNAGTTAGTNFIGTTDNIGLSFKTNNLQRMTIDNAGRVMIQPNNAVATAPAIANAIFDIVPTGPAGGGIGNMVLRGSNQNQNDPVDIEFKTWDGVTTLGKISINPSAADLWFDANGATRLALKNDGNVGIGTTNPVAKLDVVGTIKIADGTEALNRVLTSDANGLASWQPAGAGSGWTLTGNAGTTVGTNFVGTTNNVGLSFKTNNVERIRILNTGSVGIGTITPSQTLDVVGNVAIGAANSYFIGTQEVMDAAGTANIFVGGTNASAGQNNSFFGRAAGSLNTGNDNTFIGRNAGFTNGAGQFNTIVGTNAGQLFSTADGNTIVGFQAGNSFATGDRNTLIGRESDISANGITNATAIGYLAIAGASNTMVLGGTGANAVNVGIGTSTPHAQLQLATSVANRKIVLYEAANNDHEFIGFGVDGSGALRYQTAVNVNDHIFYTATSSTTSNELMRIKGTGQVGIGRNPAANQLEISGNASKAVAGGWLANSDRRIKTDIRDIDNSLELIMKVRPVKYKYTDEWMRRNPSIKDQYYYSFIAQEYQKVFPEAVQGSGEYLEGDKTEILQIDTHNAQIVTIKAVQEQQKIIETQQNEIDDLKKELAEIKNYLNMEAKVVKKKKGRK